MLGKVDKAARLECMLQFSVREARVLDEKGVCRGKPPAAGLVKQMYVQMVLSRVFDEKCLNLQRQGRMGTYASSLGQEAAQIATVYALKKEDWLVPSLRESGSVVARGTPMHMLMQYWAGDERGQNVPKSVNNFPVSIPVGTQLLHAVGIAMGAKLKVDKVV